MGEGAAATVGTVSTALAHAARLLAARPALAAAQADEILKSAPGHPEALLILGAARRAMGDASGALATLKPLAAAQPRSARTHLELGLALAANGPNAAAVAALSRAVSLDPKLADAWRALGDQHLLAGRTDDADRAYAHCTKASVTDPRLMQAAAALVDNRLAAAEAALRAHLKTFPTDVAAIRMLAEVGARLSRYGDAELLLTRCLELSPSFHAARHNLAIVLHRQGKSMEALAAIEPLIDAEPQNPNYQNLKAAVLARIGEYDDAIEIYERILREQPRYHRGWLSYGHALKTAGRSDDCVAAYRKCAELAPAFGEAAWSLANLKTFRFAEDEIAAMRAQLARDDLGAEDRFHFEYALGKALEDHGADEEAFGFYAKGAAGRRALLSYEAAETTILVDRARDFFDAKFFKARAGWGAPGADPIFIVGLPRSGSTLVEQILASHSAVEGTMELPDLGMIAREIGAARTKKEQSLYPDALAALDAEAVRALGEDYLARTRIQRKTDAPFFIDKMPNNWEHVGLIRLALPNAKIIDARRHPMATCFAAFKQHFARGQRFSYDLDDLGRYYADYVRLMTHFDAVAPGGVHRVHYETMVADTENEVRRLLAYCGLDFEPGCLAFHENARPVRTASAEQVRQPIYSDAVDHWRRFEPWLGPLQDALGECLDSYEAARVAARVSAEGQP